MPRYIAPKITHAEADRILRDAYADGYAKGLTGEQPTPLRQDDLDWLETAWTRRAKHEHHTGQTDGYTEFSRRVLAVVKPVWTSAPKGGK